MSLAHKIGAALAALWLVAAPSAFAETKSKTQKAPPEAEAMFMFQRFCILTKGQEKAVEASMGEVVKAKAGGEIPADKLAERTGIKATRAWAFRAGESHQQLLVTLSPGICALHLSEGDKGTLQREFKNLSDAMATALKGKLRQIDTKKTDKAEYTAYAVDVPNVPNEPILALSSAVGDAPSGTKHLLTFSIIKKSQE